MVVVREDAAGAAQAAVDSAGDADAEPLHPARERPLVVGLDDQVQVVTQDREMNDAEVQLR